MRPLPRRVLYIEDTIEHAQLMLSKIDKRKFDVIVEEDGEEAIRIIQCDDHKTIKAVLLDIVLTDPTTVLLSKQKYQGDQVAFEIKRMRPDIPIIAVSTKSKINSNINGYYPKRTLFDSDDMFDDLQEALSACITKEEEQEYYPEDGGGKEWIKKWGPKYIEFRNSPDFVREEIKIGEKAREDFDLLNNDQITIPYRRYRGVNSFKNVLIVRRVIFATAFHNSQGLDIKWPEVVKFLRIEKNDEETNWVGLKSFMHACGIRWGSVSNKGTMLNEEKLWLKAQGLPPL